MERSIYARLYRKGRYIRRSDTAVIKDPRVEKTLKEIARCTREPMLIALKKAVTERLDRVDRRLAGVSPWRWHLYRPHP